MLLGKETLEELRFLINKKTKYRSGSELVDLFNSLGFNDSYEPSFPPRWQYTDEKLEIINGKPELENCIKIIFNLQNFIDRDKQLQLLLEEFNHFLANDGWKIIVKGKEISFEKVKELNLSGKDDESVQN